MHFNFYHRSIYFDTYTIHLVFFFLFRTNIAIREIEIALLRNWHDRMSSRSIIQSRSAICRDCGYLFGRCGTKATNLCSSSSLYIYTTVKFSQLLYVYVRTRNWHSEIKCFRPRGLEISRRMCDEGKERKK